MKIDAGPLGILTDRAGGEVAARAGDTINFAPMPGKIHRFDDNGLAIA